MEIPDWDELHTIETRTPKGWEVTHMFRPDQVGLHKILEIFHKLALNGNDQVRLTVAAPHTKGN